MGRSDVNSSKTNLTSCITVTKSIQIFLIFVLNIYSKQKNTTLSVEHQINTTTD